MKNLAKERTRESTCLTASLFLTKLRSSRTLTHSGEQQFEEQNESHQYKLRSVKRDNDSIVMEMEGNPVLDLSVASTFRRDLSKLIQKYEKLADDKFLEAYRPKRSSQEKASVRVTTTVIRAKTSAAIQHLSALLPLEKNSTESSTIN